MKKIILAIAVAIVALFTPPAFAWDAQISSISDGDTVLVERVGTGEKVRIRLYGIDAPEGPGSRWKPQPYSRVSANFLKELLPPGALCAVMDMGLDRYERTVAGIVTLPDGKVVQEEMLQAGLAWVYPKYCHDCRQWQEIQKEAREAQRGLWKDKKPVPPWEWRKRAAP